MPFTEQLTRHVHKHGWSGVDQLARRKGIAPDDLVVALLSALGVAPDGIGDALDLLEARSSPELRASLARRVSGSGLGPLLEPLLLAVALPEAAAALSRSVAPESAGLVAWLDRLGAGSGRQAAAVEWLLTEVGTADAAVAVVDVSRRLTPMQAQPWRAAFARGAVSAPDTVDPILAQGAPGDGSALGGWWSWLAREGHPAVLAVAATRAERAPAAGPRHPLSLEARRELGAGWLDQAPALQSASLERIDRELARAEEGERRRRIPDTLHLLARSADEEGADRVLARLARFAPEARSLLARRVVERGRPLGPEARARVVEGSAHWPMADAALGVALARLDDPDALRATLRGAAALSDEGLATIHAVACWWPEDVADRVLPPWYQDLPAARLQAALSGDLPTPERMLGVWADLAIGRPEVSRVVVGRLERAGSVSTAALLALAERSTDLETRRRTLAALGRVGHLGAAANLAAMAAEGGLLEPSARAAAAAIGARHPAPPPGSVSTGEVADGQVSLVTPHASAAPAPRGPVASGWAALRAPPRAVSALVTWSLLAHGHPSTALAGYGTVAATASIAAATQLSTFPATWAATGLAIGGAIIALDVWGGWGKWRFLRTAELAASNRWTDSTRDQVEIVDKKKVVKHVRVRTYHLVTASGRVLDWDSTGHPREEAPVWFLLGRDFRKVGDLAATVRADGSLRPRAARLVASVVFPLVAAWRLVAWLA